MQPEKKRKFSFKQVFIVLILIGVLVVGGGLTYLKSYFDSNRLKKLVIPKLEAALNRDIEIKDINLKFWRGVGIRVNEVKIANAQGFNEKYLAQVDEFTVDIALLPLLQREIKIEEVKLVKPIIQLAKKESGEVNYKFRTGKSSSQDSEQVKKNKNPLGFLISVDELQIIDGKLKYLDQISNLNIDVAGINSTTISTLKKTEQNLLTTGEIGVNKLDISGAKEVNLDNIVSEFDLNVGEEKIKADKLTFNTKNSKLKLAGIMNYKQYLQTGDYKSLDLKLDLTSKLDLAEIRQLLVGLNSQFNDYNFKGELESDLAVEFRLGDIIGDNKNLERVKINGDLEFAGDDINLPGFREEFNQVSGRIEASGRKLDLNKLHCKLAQSNLIATGEVMNWNNILAAAFKKDQLDKDAKIKLNLNSDLLVVDELLNLTSAKDSNETNKRFKKADSKSDSGVIKDIPVTGSVEISKLEYSNLVMENVTGDLSLIDRLLKLDNLKSNVAQGWIKGKAEMDLTDSKPEYQGRVEVDQVETNQLLSSFTSFKDSLYGSLNLTTNFSGQGFSQQNIKEHLTLQGKAVIEDGKLTASGIIDKLNKLFNIFKEDYLKLNKMQGSVNLKNGKLYLNDFTSNTLQGKIEFSGYSTLEGSLDYELSYLLSKDKSKEIKLSQKELFYADDSDQVQLDFELIGDVSDPTLKWDKSRIKERTKEKAEKKVKEEIENKEDKLKDKVKELF